MIDTRQLIAMLREEADGVLLALPSKGYEFASVMREAAYELELNRWRRFGDEQPDFLVEVLAYLDNGKTIISRMELDNSWMLPKFSGMGPKPKVTHWRRIPDGPL